DARKKACEAGARAATMPGITMEMLREGAFLADYSVVKKRTDKIARLLTKAKEIRIKTSLGSDFSASLRGRKSIADSGIIAKKGAFGNLPAGEAFIAPVEGSSSGVLVFDGSFSSLGVLREPLKLQIEKGKVASCEGSDAGKMMQVLKKYKNASNVAEIGIGTNEKARLIGNVLEDEKVFGTAHVALGDNHTFGGKTRAEIHIDGIIKRPDVWLDGRQIMREGELLH
ncbi:MAG: aminopeptidase, partial [Methanobacteriota archaeon]